MQKVVEEVKQEEEKKKNVDSSRCKSCNKKIGIYGYECKCAFFFCGKHRLPEDHNCEFDHTTDAKNKLIK